MPPVLTRLVNKDIIKLFKETWESRARTAQNIQRVYDIKSTCHTRNVTVQIAKVMKLVKKGDNSRQTQSERLVTEAKDIHRANLERNASNNRQTQLEQLVTVAKEILWGESQDKWHLTTPITREGAAPEFRSRCNPWIHERSKTKARKRKQLQMHEKQLHEKPRGALQDEAWSARGACLPSFHQDNRFFQDF